MSVSYLQWAKELLGLVNEQLHLFGIGEIEKAMRLESQKNAIIQRWNGCIDEIPKENDELHSLLIHLQDAHNRLVKAIEQKRDEIAKELANALEQRRLEEVFRVYQTNVCEGDDGYIG